MKSFLSIKVEHFYRLHLLYVKVLLLYVASCLGLTVSMGYRMICIIPEGNLFGCYNMAALKFILLQQEMSASIISQQQKCVFKAQRH